MVLFFPCWLEHDVEENDSDEDRISIAFNIFADINNDKQKSKEAPIIWHS